MEFKSIQIDIEKGIYLLNGQKIENVSDLELIFEKGSWSLKTTQEHLYESKVTGVTIESSQVVSQIQELAKRIWKDSELDSDKSKMTAIAANGQLQSSVIVTTEFISVEANKINLEL